MKQHLKTISMQLLQYGIKPSYQRMRIMEYLMENRTHPTVNDIYKALIETIPSLSKTTVYNTLNLFKEHGIVKALNIDDIEARYDIHTHAHAHFYCERCHFLQDVEVAPGMEFLPIQDSGIASISSMEILAKGLCKKCAKLN